MKPITAIFILMLGLMLVGCSAGETSQDQIEKDAKDITLDSNVTPDDAAANNVSMPGPKKGGQ